MDCIWCRKIHAGFCLQRFRDCQNAYLLRDRLPAEVATRSGWRCSSTSGGRSAGET